MNLNMRSKMGMRNPICEPEPAVGKTVFMQAGEWTGIRSALIVDTPLIHQCVQIYRLRISQRQAST